MLLQKMEKPDCTFRDLDDVTLGPLEQSVNHWL